jgi:hypothetical protein
MAESNKAKARLVAARPAARDESAGYMPRIPWRYVLLGLLSVSTVTAGFLFNERRKADALRAQITLVHEQELAEPARRYREFRDKLEGFITAAASKAPDDFADKRLRIAGLRSGKGLYLRLPAKDAASRAGIARGAKEMTTDAIPSCLGLSPASARGLWEKGEFLLPSWLGEVKKTTNVMRLRVIDTVLARHIKSDLPLVLNMLQADWFLLVLEQGPSRRTAPVDAFLWDVKSSQQLLRGRVQAAGVLLPVRVRSKDAPSSPRLAADQLEPATAADCSIAGQLKAIAGTPLATMQNEPPVPSLATQPPPKPAGAAAPAPAPALPGGAQPPPAPQAPAAGEAPQATPDAPAPGSPEAPKAP